MSYFLNQTNQVQNQLLSTVTPQLHEILFQNIELVTLKFGQPLYESGSPLSHVYFPTTAIISMMNVLENGSSTEIGIIGIEGIVGLALFMGGSTIPSRAIVIRTGLAYRIKGTIFQIEFDRNPELQHLILRYTLALFTMIAQSVVCKRHHSLTQQLCRLFLLILDRISGNELFLTQEFLAYILGVRREGVSSASVQLQGAGLIHYHRGKIIIIDRQGLEDRSCECYQVVKNEYQRLLPPNS